MDKKLRFWITLGIVVILIILGSYIGGLLNDSDSGVSKSLGVPSRSIVNTLGGDADIVSESVIIEPPGFGTSPSTEPVLDRKIIRNANLGIKVKDFKTSLQEVIDISETVGGFISSSSSNIDKNGVERGNVQIRIPAERFTETLSLLEDIGEVRSRNILGNDVTEQYLDLESKLTNLEKQEKRLQEILEQADTVEELLNIERELNRIRTQIDYNTGRLNFLNDRVEFSTITVNLFEEQLIKEGGLLDTIKDSLNLFFKSIKNLILFVGAILPYVVIILIVLLLIKVYRKVKKKRKKKF